MSAGTIKAGKWVSILVQMNRYRRLKDSKSSPEYSKNVDPIELHSHAKICYEASQHGQGATPQLAEPTARIGIGMKLLMSVATPASCVALSFAAVYSGAFPPLRWEVCASTKESKPLSLAIIGTSDNMGCWLHEDWLYPAEVLPERHEVVTPLYAKIAAIYIYTCEEKEIMSTASALTAAALASSTLDSTGQASEGIPEKDTERFSDKASTAGTTIAIRRWKFSGVGYGGPVAQVCVLLMPTSYVDSLVTFGSPPSFSHPDQLFPFPHTHVQHTYDIHPHTFSSRNIAKLLLRLQGLGHIFPAPPSEQLLKLASFAQPKKEGEEGNGKKDGVEGKEKGADAGSPKSRKKSVTITPHARDGGLAQRKTSLQSDQQPQQQQQQQQQEPRQEPATADVRSPQLRRTSSDIVIKKWPSASSLKKAVTELKANGEWSASSPMSDSTADSPTKAQSGERKGSVSATSDSGAKTNEEGQQQQQQQGASENSPTQEQQDPGSPSIVNPNIAKPKSTSILKIVRVVREKRERINMYIHHNSHIFILYPNPSSLVRDTSDVDTMQPPSTSHTHRKQLSHIARKSDVPRIEFEAMHSPFDIRTQTNTLKIIDYFILIRILLAKSVDSGVQTHVADGAEILNQYIAATGEFQSSQVGQNVARLLYPEATAQGIDMMPLCERMLIQFPRLMYIAIRQRESNNTSGAPTNIGLQHPYITPPFMEMHPTMYACAFMESNADTIEGLASFLKQYKAIASFDATSCAKRLMEWGGEPPLRHHAAALFCQTNWALFFCTNVPKKFPVSRHVSTAVLNNQMSKEIRQLVASKEGYHVCWTVTVTGLCSGVSVGNLIDVIINGPNVRRASVTSNRSDETGEQQAEMTEQEAAARKKQQAEARRREELSKAKEHAMKLIALRQMSPEERRRHAEEEKRREEEEEEYQRQEAIFEFAEEASRFLKIKWAPQISQYMLKAYGKPSKVQELEEVARKARQSPQRAHRSTTVVVTDNNTNAAVSEGGEPKKDDAITTPEATTSPSERQQSPTSQRKSLANSEGGGSTRQSFAGSPGRSFRRSQSNVTKDDTERRSSVHSNPNSDALQEGQSPGEQQRKSVVSNGGSEAGNGGGDSVRESPNSRAGRLHRTASINSTASKRDSLDGTATSARQTARDQQHQQRQQQQLSNNAPPASLAPLLLKLNFEELTWFTNRPAICTSTLRAAAQGVFVCADGYSFEQLVTQIPFEKLRRSPGMEKLQLIILYCPPRRRIVNPQTGAVQFDLDINPYLEASIATFCNNFGIYYAVLDMKDPLSCALFQRLLVQWIIPTLNLPLDPMSIPATVEIGQLLTHDSRMILEYLLRSTDINDLTVQQFLTAEAEKAAAEEEDRKHKRREAEKEYHKKVEERRAKHEAKKAAKKAAAAHGTTTRTPGTTPQQGSIGGRTPGTTPRLAHAVVK